MNRLMLFKKYIYVKVYKNAFELALLDSGRGFERFESSEPFTTQRLLVGNFDVAEQCLRQAMDKTIKDGILKSSKIVLMHPMDMCEGGLCPVEERVMIELAFCSGAKKNRIHQGPALTPEEALGLLKKL